MSTIAWVYWAIFGAAFLLWCWGMRQEITRGRFRYKLPRGYGRIARMARYWGFW